VLTQDAPRLPIPPARDCTKDHPGAIFTGTVDFNPNSPDWTGYAYPWNLIYKEWMRIGGPNSAIGCPTNNPDSADSPVQFEHGQIAVSTGVWEQGVLAAYQDGNEITVDWTVSWTDPSHFNYDRFLLRWDVNGFHDDIWMAPNLCESGTGAQCNIFADMGGGQPILLNYYMDTHLRTKGTTKIPHYQTDAGVLSLNNCIGCIPEFPSQSYKIGIEGCDEGGLLTGIKCRQGWMHAVTVEFKPRPNDDDELTKVSPDYPIALPNIRHASDVATSQGEFSKRAAAITLYNACRLLPYKVYRNEEEYMTIVLAKLEYLNFYQDDYCPGRTVRNRDEAIASLAQQSVDSKVGTSVHSIPFRTGEYDVALSGYAVILYRFGSILPSAVYDHILNDLMDVRGRLDLADHVVDEVIPESENHINMIESARYLTNQLLFARTGLAQYDNVSNGMRDYWLRQLQQVLQTDFIEYNSRPYQSYTMRAIQNLYSFSTDPQVKTAAEMVLNYISAKLAVSSSDNRRVVPYRRKKEANKPELLGYQSDPQLGRLLVLGGSTDIFRDTGGRAPWYSQDDMQMAIASSYRIPDLILDLLINPAHRNFYQGIHHYADELYAGSPNVLISAGGHYATNAYKVPIFGGKDDDIGLALATTVMPRGTLHSRDDLIRFEGVADDTERANMCVAPNFACGMYPAALSDAMKRCQPVYDGPWTFVNSTPSCQPRDSGGFFAALYQGDAVVAIDPPMNYRYGFVEIFDTFSNPELTFEDFTAAVKANNGSRIFSPFSTSNVYTTVTGERITFQLLHDSRVLGIENGPPLSESTTKFATGSIINSTGATGLVTITNPYTGDQLILDHRDTTNPVQTLVHVLSLTADSCLPGFVWRGATADDHICVTGDKRSQTLAENALAQARRSDNGGAYGPDTCKDGFVWRDAVQGDHVCVPVSSRTDAQWDNKLARSRSALPPSP
jgi:hypothetical protein